MLISTKLVEWLGENILINMNLHTHKFYLIPTIYFFRYLSISKPLSSINTSKQRKRAKYVSFFSKNFLSQHYFNFPWDSGSDRFWVQCTEQKIFISTFQVNGLTGLAPDPDILLATGRHIQSPQASKERLLSMHNFQFL